MSFDRKQTEAEEIEEDLETLDLSIKRLRIEYEQYFLGVMRRPPVVLLARVQKLIVKFASAQPRNTRQKFRFNQLNSKFQVMRQQWGRITRQIEEGTYKPHLFKAKLHEKEREEHAPSKPDPQQEPKAKRSEPPRSGLDQLCEAFTAARRLTGEHTAVDREALARVVKQQTAAIREKYGDARVRFKVVIDGDRAKVKASVSRS